MLLYSTLLCWHFLVFSQNSSYFAIIFSQNSSYFAIIFSQNSGCFSAYLVAGAGLEPATFGLWAQRAANCSTPRCVNIFIILLHMLYCQYICVNFLNLPHALFLCLLYYMQNIEKYSLILKLFFSPHYYPVSTLTIKIIIVKAKDVLLNVLFIY